MKSLCLALLVLSSLAPLGGTARAAGVQRFALVAAANDGGPDRPLLRYAVSDARRFAAVLVELGGVSPANAILLEEPDRAELESAIDQLRTRVAEAARSASDADGGRTEILVYYSGHADETGLRLGEERFPYRTLRDRLDGIPADVRIAVLDACASGAFTRLKGGQLQQPFLVDESSAMRGHVFLTSSAETEAAQESDHIQASYFTHFLISGLRGAADANGEGKVTLNEAYQFAYDETLGRTLDTQGGAQHPSYDIKLSGAGDVVITDLRGTAAGLVLDESIDGRFFVRNARQELVVELYKPAGRRVELGLEPGAYEVRVERDAAAYLARTEIPEGAHVALTERQFLPVSPEATRQRGRLGPPVFAMAGRNRIGLRFGMWRLADDETYTVSAGVRTTNLLLGLQYCRYLTENTTITLVASVLRAEAGVAIDPQRVATNAVGVTAIFLGLQWNPMGGDAAASALRPYLALGLGPVMGSSRATYVAGLDVYAGAESQVTAGGHTGAGVDVLLSRHWAMGLAAGYNWVGDFARPIGGRSDYSGFELSVSLGWLFGRGYGAGSR